MYIEGYKGRERNRARERERERWRDGVKKRVTVTQEHYPLIGFQ